MKLGILAQFLSLVAWQSGLIVQKLLVTQSSVASIMLLQLGLACLVLWLGLAIFGRRLPPLNLRTATNLGWGLMAPGLVFALGIAGAVRTDGVSIALIWGLFPLVGPIIARLLIGEPSHWSIYAGGTLAFAGVALLTLSRAESGTSDIVGNALVFAAVACAATNATIGRVMNRDVRRWPEVATLQITGATAGALVTVLVFGWEPPPLTEAGNVMALAYLVMFMTVANFLAYNIALARIPVALISLNASSSPLFGLISAWIILGSTLRPSDSLYAALILLGVMAPHAVRYAGRNRRSSP